MTITMMFLLINNWCSTSKYTKSIKSCRTKTVKCMQGRPINYDSYLECLPGMRKIKRQTQEILRDADKKRSCVKATKNDQRCEG